MTFATAGAQRQLADAVHRNNGERQQQHLPQCPRGQPGGAEQLAAVIDQQQLDNGNRGHNNDKRGVVRQIRQHIHPIGARVKAVEDAGEDEQREKRGHQINRLGVVMQQRFAHRQLQKRHAQHNGVQPHAQNLVQHIPVQHRFVPSFGRFAHIRGQRRLARKRQPRQRIHNHIDPQHLHHRHRRVQESVTNIRVIKSFVREDHEKAKFYDAADRLCDISVKASGLMVTIMPLMQLVMNLTTVGALWLGGNMVQSGEIAIGGLMSYSTYIMHILMSMMMMSMAIMMFSRARASAARLKEVLAEQSTITDPEHPVTAPVQKGEVEFRHVSFRYNETSPDLVLDDVSFTAHPGEVIAVVGATGSAKSSLVNLIPRLYDATDGQVLVDGVDVRDYAIRTLREGIGMVPQQNVLFSGTIADNIRWGDPDATDDEVEQAARDAQAHDFIMSFPEGYQTMLSQGGVNVSGGQKQRLCIARAMIKKPRVLILDDSTSAVDSDTEGRIRESFSQHLKGTTVFIIAQRISSIKTADRILVLDSGKVAGFGTHEELIASNTIYQEIVSSQQKGVSA